MPSLIWAKTIIRYEIDGLKDKPLQNVTAALEAAEKTALSRNDTLDKNDLMRLFYSNESLIKTALQPYGYFTTSITAAYQKTGDDKWQFSYRVRLGRPIRLAQVRVKIEGPGKNNQKFIHWKQHFPLKDGDVFKSEKYTDAKQSFYTLANRLGYIKAKLKQHRVNIDLNDYTASMTLIYDTGEQYFFGAVDFAPATLKESFMRKFIIAKPGQPYSIPHLLQSQQNLSNSGYFADVKIQQQKKKMKNNHIPLYIRTHPVKKMQYTAGVGYGTDTGYRGQLGWNWRQINSSGHHLETNYSLSQIGSSFGSTYYIPGNNPLEEQYSLSVNTSGYDTDAGQSRTQRYGVNYIRNHKHWQYTSSLTYQNENFTLSGGPSQRAHLLMPSLTVMYLDTNDPIKPKYGFRLSINVQGASKDVVSDLSFTQYQVDARALIPINHRNRFFLRTNFGGTFTKQFDLLPLSLRFTAGGAQSIRGYAFQSLGPAKNLLVTSAAYQFRVVSDWFVSYFQDYGNAFNDAKNMNLQRSQGGGIVWQSPIGTMELDYAQSITQPEKRGMVQFSMGSLL